MAEMSQSNAVEPAGLPPEVVSVLMGISVSGVVSGGESTAGDCYADMRGSKRIKASLRCSVLTAVGGQRLSLAGYTADISTGGLGWYSSVSLPTKHTLAMKVEYQLDGKPECLVASGTIVGKVLSGANGYRYSVRFDKVSDAHRVKLGRFIAMRIRAASS